MMRYIVSRKVDFVVGTSSPIEVNSRCEAGVLADFISGRHGIGVHERDEGEQNSREDSELHCEKVLSVEEEEYN